LLSVGPPAVPRDLLCEIFKSARQRLVLFDGASQSIHTFGLKTAVSIPDDLFARADLLADRLGKSRSEIYREALADYVSRREPGAVTRELNEIADELAGDRDEFGNGATRRALERTEW